MHRVLTAAGLLALCLIFAFTALRAEERRAAGSRGAPSWIGTSPSAAIRAG